MSRTKETKDVKAIESAARGRGRPPKEGALSAADRTRRYREKQKAAGLIKRYVVTENADPSQAEDLAYWVANSQRVGELLREALSKRDYLKSEVERLQAENESLWARMKDAERYNTVKEKELIVAREKSTTLQGLDRNAVIAARKLPPIPEQAPESVARDLKDQAKILGKKLMQIEKLKKDATAIDLRFRETVNACKRLS